MPNHFHCIWECAGPCADVGANPCVRPPKQNHDILNEGAHAGAPLQDIVNDSDLIENISGSPLSAVVGWFKTMSTNEYIRGVKQLGWPPFDGKLWQRNYYEHIIRNDQSLWEISDYIINNPARWSDDKFFPDNDPVIN